MTQRIRGDCVYMVTATATRRKGLTFAYKRGASDSELITRYKVDPIMGGTGNERELRARSSGPEEVAA